MQRITSAASLAGAALTLTAAMFCGVAGAAQAVATTAQAVADTAQADKNATATSQAQRTAPGAQRAGAPDAVSDPAAARELESFLAALKSFQAQFDQTLRDSSGRVREQASGRLYLEKPGRFRWEYAEPNEQLIVSDGRNLWLYDLDLEQVTVKRLDASLATTPASLLAGEAGVAENFIVKAPVRSEGLRWFELVPLRQDTDFTRLRLGFADAQGGRKLQLSAMELHDKLNQQTLIRFSAAQSNASLQRSLFSFVPPEGVDVIGSAQR